MKLKNHMIFKMLHIVGRCNTCHDIMLFENGYMGIGHHWDGKPYIDIFCKEGDKKRIYQIRDRGY